MIPSFDASTGLLPPGTHEATWDEFVARFGWTPRRLTLLAGLKAALDALRAVGCRRAYIDGSFVTAMTAQTATAATSVGGMIANDLQYRITRAAAREFDEALARLDSTEAHRSPEARALMRAAMESQVEELRQQLAEYESLRAGSIRVLELDSLEQLPDALIRARIAAGLTQRELAARLGMREQQIQRYEATRYSGVSLYRVQAVADALGMKIHERIVLPAPASGAATEPAETTHTACEAGDAAAALGSSSETNT